MLRQYLQPRKFELSRPIVQGADGVALGQFEYTVRSNGRPFEGQFALHLTVTDGRFVRYHMYEDSYTLERPVTGH
jgi:ketosteroid isomerase-like protein